LQVPRPLLHCVSGARGYDASRLMAEAPRVPEVPAWLRGEGEMLTRVREHDWSGTPLGPIRHWPLSLQTVVGMLLHSRHPMFLWWGPELIQIYNDGYVPSFGVGKHPLALGQPGRECWQEIWPIIGPQIEDVRLRAMATWHEDALVPIFRNGRLEDVFWTYGYSPVFDESGAVAGVLVVCTETTERVRASQREKAALAQVELERSTLYRFFEQVPAGICIIGGDELVFEFANARYGKLVGRSDLAGKALLEALPELTGQGFDELLRRVMATNEMFLGREVRVMLARDANEPQALNDVYCTFIYSPLRNVMGVTDGVVVLVLDVTDQVVARRQAEDLALQLQQSGAEFRTLAESMPQLAWSARADGFIDWYNRRWYEYTGTTLAEMQGWGWRSVHDAGLVDEVAARWSTAIAEGRDFEMEFPLRRGDGVFRWHLTRAVPLRDESGKVVRWFGTNTDIDDARRLQAERTNLLATAQGERERAEAANRAKDEFLATASHELRTPLNAILGWARLLRTGQRDASFYERGVQTIERNAEAQIRLIEDILDGSRIITGKLQLDLRSVEVTALMRAALDALRPAAQAKEIVLSVELDTEGLRVSGDSERLQQVVWNLVNNAIKFTPQGGAVDVRAARLDDELELTVADNGQGIEPEFLPHVFERFRQAESSTTRRHGGLGLGLALVKHLIDAHQGTVEVESAGRGLGATFKVLLPLEASSARGTTIPASMPAHELDLTDVDLRGVRVLVVDDEQDARELLATILRGSGASVALAANVGEALRFLEGDPPSILLSDVGMPETDGYELMRRLRGELALTNDRLPAVALTAYAREEDRRLALAAGFQAHIAKPVEPAELLRLVAKLVPARR
jgi:PAS domain S-box-containing protein